MRAVALAVLLLFTPVLPAAAWSLEAERSALLDAVNATRAAHGLSTLERDSRLDAAAQSHSEDMADRRTLGHRGREGTQVDDRAERAGYPYRMIAENVASAAVPAARVVALWMESPGHRENILLPDLRHAGTGLALAPADRPEAPPRRYWTLVLGAPRQQ